MAEIKVPDIGNNSDVNVAEILVKVGDEITLDDNLIVLETDKATIEVPADKKGKISEIIVKVGSKVKQGDLILKLTDVVEDDKDKIKNISSQQQTCDVVVIGAGPGGYAAAFRAADLGQKVILIEQHATLGGVCLNVGCIPSKALLHIAKVINDVDNIASHGVTFAKPKIELDKIRQFKDNAIKKLTTGLTGLAKQRKVTTIQGRANFTTKNEIEVVNSNNEVNKIEFKFAIVAVGSRPFKVPGFPEDPRIIDSTGALKLEDIPKRMLIVGGGIIGLEMAEVYSSLGSKVTIVELGNDLIPSADRDLVKVLENRIKKRYVAIYTNTKCTKVEANTHDINVIFEGSGAPSEPQAFDKILLAAGRIPNGKDISAEKAGINVDDKGFIKVDKQGRTNVDNIYAIGDVVSQPMLAHKASYEGKIAAQNCAGINSYFDARVIPSVAYTDPEIAWMGVTETEAKKANMAYDIGKFPWAASGRAITNGRDDGFTKIITNKDTGRIIGAGIVGVNAGELLAEATLALEMNCDIHDVALSIHAHPTLSESVALACEMIDGSITDLYVPKK